MWCLSTLSTVTVPSYSGLEVRDETKRQCHSPWVWLKIDDIPGRKSQSFYSPSIPFVGYAINDADSTEELCQIVF